MRWSYTLAGLVLAFGKTGSPQAPLPPTELHFRISVNLVEVDATVTDTHGNRVPGLTSDDFQILLDGKPQRIASTSFVESGKVAATPTLRQPVVPRKLEAAMPPTPAAPLKREDVKRTIVLFIDDFSMAAETVPRVRAGLRKFIQTQMRPGDLVAVVRASAGLGALQDFTTDRNLLLAAADHARWNPSGRGTMEVNDADAPVDAALIKNAPGKPGEHQPGRERCSLHMQFAVEAVAWHDYPTRPEVRGDPLRQPADSHARRN